MTTPLGATLEREHRTIDDAILRFVDAGPSAATREQHIALLDAVAVLRRHIYLEEQYLFPPLRAAGLVGPVMVMVHEHALMWPLLDQIERLVADRDFDNAAQQCRNLLEMLNSHNMKEERILYPQADTLPQGDLDELAELLSTAELPAGWVCGGVTIT
ncbi:hemerythrin domain-containing protein [Mycobacterium sp. 21AC1]|uniref:hemerythrin domain-containing protein n=1 Tax=[Mycobacterium] appelbergii TaxID=2939269 RepID=UPI002938F4A1|nr:hemerythrin domain-containing protein [Mycobacterium sp. 21AC1]MDV3124116.1 hemerythrin domain-containing protein [Mycobacterium sp. 21AC1]